VWTFKDAGTWAWELSDVRVNPEIAPAMFDLPTPEGFRRFDPPPPVSPTTAPASGATRTGNGLQTSLGGARVTGLIPGSLAPDFTLPMVTLDASGPGVVPVKGKSFTLSAERSSVIVLDFFGSWNAQSKSAAPEMARMAAALRGKPVKIISLAVRERDEAKPIEFLSQTPYATALLPAADEVAKLYKARVIPTYFVVGLEGEIVYTNSTYGRDVTVKEVQDVIERYLQSRHAAGAPGDGAGDRSGDTTK
jgi:thiol-disulfide isomerase/thioredoxin